jgi:hypothetical protein
MKTTLQSAITLCLFTCLASSANASNLLDGGDFEPSIPGWTLQEYATANPNAFVDSADLMPWGIDWDLGESINTIWLKPFAGGADLGPNNLTTAAISQSVPAVAGESYTFKADSRWETYYSGGVITLEDAFCGFIECGPMQGQSSPTSTQLEMVFLDSLGVPIGSPTVLDLRSEQNNSNWFPVTHNLSAVAPSGTSQVRVTAKADAMVYNADPHQSAFFEKFSLRAATNPLSELLVNARLDQYLAGLEPWTITFHDDENSGNTEVVRVADFSSNSNHTTDGEQGLYLSPWFGEPGTPVDGSVSQIVAALPGRTYEFSAWSRIEENYLADLTFMELSFLDATTSIIGSPVVLDIAAAGQIQDGVWREFLLSAIAPQGTTSLKVSVGMIDGVFNTDPGQSAFFDDLSLVQSVPEPSVTYLLATVSILRLFYRKRFARHAKQQAHSAQIKLATVESQVASRHPWNIPHH